MNDSLYDLILRASSQTWTTAPDIADQASSCAAWGPARWRFSESLQLILLSNSQFPARKRYPCFTAARSIKRSLPNLTLSGHPWKPADGQEVVVCFDASWFFDASGSSVFGEQALLYKAELDPGTSGLTFELVWLRAVAPRRTAGLSCLFISSYY